MSNQKNRRSKDANKEDPILRAQLAEAASLLIELYLWESARRRSGNDQEDAFGKP
jgi:hypothetical protein